MSADELLFEKGGVFVHTSVPSGNPDEDILISGTLKIVKKEDGRYVVWNPDEEVQPIVPKTKVDHGWAVVDAVSYHNGENGISELSVSPPNSSTNGQTPVTKQHQYKIDFNIEDLKSVKQSNRSFGWPYLIFIMKDGTTFPALHFHCGGSRSMMQKLKSFLYIKQSASDSRLFLVHEQDPNALHKSFDELNLFDTTAPKLVSKFFHDPFSTTLGGFSKVTNFVRDSFLQENQLQTREDFAQILQQTERELALQTNDQDEPGYELITHAAEIPPRKNVNRGPPLTTKEWTRHMDKDGRVVNVPELKEFIFKGGISDASLRIDVWKFLLHYYPWDSTFKDRMELRKKKVDDYFRIKLQWKSICPEQAKRFSLFRERESLIEKDVNRTDRTHEFYQGTNNPHLDLLRDILMTYSMYNFDLGYVQGMSDLLSPILFIMENEVDAFWCFCGFMELVQKNFEMDQEGMKKQLSQLHTLVQFMDTELCNHLESHESSNMFFCFRWLLIMFKREFVFADVMRLWEVLWTGRPCPNFHLLICVAILDNEKPVLIENNFGFNEILKHINDICFQINLEEVLRKAEAMYKQLQGCRNLPRSVCEIVGIPYSPSVVIVDEPGTVRTSSSHPADLCHSASGKAKPGKAVPANDVPSKGLPSKHIQVKAVPAKGAPAKVETDRMDSENAPSIDASTKNPLQ